MSTAGETILASHGGGAHHQAADDGHGLADGGGQPQPGLLEDLKGHQHEEHLEHGGEGHVPLGGDDGQGQPGGDHLLVEVDHGDIHGGQQQGAEDAQAPQQGEDAGGHPVVGLVLRGPEELPRRAGAEVAQGQALHQNAHPPLGQPGAEAVGPLGVEHQGEGGGGVVHDILLQIAGGEQGVDVDGGHPLLHPAYQVLVGDVVQPQDVHRGQGLPPHDLLPNLQLRGPEVAAHQAGVAAQILHKGVPGPP